MLIYKGNAIFLTGFNVHIFCTFYPYSHNILVSEFFFMKTAGSNVILILVSAKKKCVQKNGLTGDFQMVNSSYVGNPSYCKLIMVFLDVESIQSFLMAGLTLCVCLTGRHIG